MNVLKNMELIFVASAVVLCATGYASAEGFGGGCSTLPDSGGCFWRNLLLIWIKICHNFSIGRKTVHQILNYY